MIKCLDSLNRKVRPAKAKEVVSDIVNGTAKKVRKKQSHWREKARSNAYERAPKSDTVEVKNAEKKPEAAKDKKKEEKVDTKNRVWNFYERQNKRIAKGYINDLESVAQEIPEAFFSREANKFSVKGMESTLDKLMKNEGLFAQGGVTAAVRDGVRGTIFMPNPQEGYMKIVKAMEKRGYKIDETFLEREGMVVIGDNGLPLMGKDIDVRFGENAVPSGYEDVQMRFYKGKGKKKQVYELLILTGPNYLNIKNKEHELIYEQFRSYKSSAFRDDRGAKSIIDAMKEQFNILTRKLYADAKSRDVNGAAAVTEAITFEPKAIVKIKEYLKSLKELFAGKHAMLPPSKRTKPFKETQKYKQLDKLEQNLRQVLDIYKPIEK